MSDRVYGPEEKSKLERLIKEGASVLQEVEDLQAGLRETVKAVAEELDVKPSLINKAIKVAKNRDWDKHQNEFEDLETIVAVTGYDKDA
jgi:transposase-like protein